MVKRMGEEERKKEIMTAAAKVIAEKGLSGATMEDIIAGTTLSKGGVYHYYGNVVEVFKDMMMSGIDYRNEFIREHFRECKKGHEKQFMSEQFFEKIVSDNPYVPLYVEFLVAKKRNPKLQHLMDELQQKTKEKFSEMQDGSYDFSFLDGAFRFLTDFINAMIMASDILEARESFIKNRKIIEKMFLLIFEEMEKGE